MLLRSGSVEVGLFQMICDGYLKKRVRNFDNLLSLACHCIKLFFVSEGTHGERVYGLKRTAPGL